MRVVVGAILALALGEAMLGARMRHDEARYLQILDFQEELMSGLIRKSLEVHALDQRVQSMETRPSPACPPTSTKPWWRVWGR